MKSDRRIKLFFIVLFFLFLNPGLVFALEINYPRVPGVTPPQDFIGSAPPEQILPLYVLYIFNLVIWISGVIAIGVMVYAGIRYLISAGKPEAIISARNQISSAFLGILILLSSFLILRILNPQLIVLEIPEPEPVELVERPEMPSPPAESYLSSIDAEIPFGRIIEERIFESYVPPGETRKPRMTRIKENASTTLNLATALRNSNENLNSAVHGGCSCSNASPVCPGCSSCSSCTCDPCSPVRGTITYIENYQNLPNIEKLKIEQEKTIEEVRLLREELTKLERTENYLTQDCRLWTIQSLKEFLMKVDEFKEGGELRQIRFWDDIDTIYYSQKEKKEIRDWASFYCPVGGTTFLEQPSTPLLESPKPGIPEEYTKVIKSCPQEVPIGEIIDRTKRVGKLLVKRMEKLVEKDKEMIEAVEVMQVLVSQCTSQVPRCHSVCILVCSCGDDGCDCVCVESCEGTPCPFFAIAQQAQKIAQIQQEIEKLVKQEDGIETIGIIPIIDRVVPKILEDLEKEVRFPMRECIIKGGDKVLFDCQRLIGALDPKGDIIRTCCNKEPVFNECLEKCYLEQGQEKYKKCLTECLNKRAEETGLEDIVWCRHQLNFFCCNIEKELLR